MSARTSKPAGAAGGASPAQAAAAPARRVPFTASSCLELLMSRATDRLSSEELRWIAADGLTRARSIASDASAVADGVACLVAQDSGDGKIPGAGSFQGGEDVFTLLVHLGSVFDQVAGLISISATAAEKADKLDKADQAGAR